MKHRKLSALLSALALAFVLPLHAQSTSATAPQSELKPATRPKSDRRNLYSLLPDSIMPNPLLDYIIITEMTDAGRKLPPPSFEKPVYYTISKNAAAAAGGANESLFKFLETELITALASNGYRLHDPNDRNNTPTQTLLFTWGRLNPVAGVRNVAPDAGGIGDIHLITRSKTPPQPADGDIADIPDLINRAKILGGQKFADKFAKALSDQIHLERAIYGMHWTGDIHIYGDSHESPLLALAETNRTTYALVDAAFKECYYVHVTSHDSGALDKPLLWSTRMAMLSQGVNFERAMPGMIGNVAYFYGRETDGPEYLRKRAYKRATVGIGKPTVVDYEAAQK